jgi:AraC-like DNA-binding protein
MWAFFEPELRKRLAEVTSSASTIERVHAALVALLPSGRASVGDVAHALGITVRTLQRNLAREETSFARELGRTRERLARHYLQSSLLPHAEISLLLGYDEPSSFFRAFRQWSGSTPEALRNRARA